ncbi:MAG: hypothetical protein LBI42_15100 [Chitinispirillales bacterium]|nr:hypothetical protein [Chitinispirillales bacterium]
MRRNEAVRRVRERSNGSEDRVSVIPFMAGRPERESVICADDLVNLKIALEVCRNFEDFLSVI